MAYTEPGIEVIQELQAQAVNVAGAVQSLVIVGELYEVFEDEVHGTGYDPVTGAGFQTFAWPGKKTSSIVDLAGVRKSIAEVDSQLNEAADYALAWSLRDPSTSRVFALDPLTDVYDINQTGFKIVEGVDAAAARASGSVASASKDREFHLRAGGLISAGVVSGDRVRLANGGFDVRGTVTITHDDNVFYTPDGHDLEVKTASLAAAVALIAEVSTPATLPATGRLAIGSGATLEWADYSAVVVVAEEHTFTVNPLTFAHAAGEAVEVMVQDTVNAASTTIADLVTAPGYITEDSVGGFTGFEGKRVAMWVENKQVNDGAVAGGDNIVQSATMGLTYADVGKKVTFWSDQVGDGAKTQFDGDLGAVAGQLSSALETFAAADVGKVIKIGSDYRRITSLVSASGPGIVTYSGAFITGTGITFVVYGQLVRTIMSVDSGTGDFTVDGAAITGAQTVAPLVLHRAVYRDLVTADDNDDNKILYSGSAVSSDTGFLKNVPVDIYDEDLDYEIFADYELLVTYRALDVSSINQELGVYTPSDLSALATVVKDNPLIWAGSSSLTAMGTADTLVYLLPVNLYQAGDETGYPEDRSEAQGYLDALEILERNSNAYFFVPLTRNTTVRDAFVAHIVAMSEPCEKNERMCYLTYALPLGLVESTTGQIEPGLDGGNKVLSDVGQNFLSEHLIIPGNTVVIQTPAAFAGEYIVASGSTEDELLLEGDNWNQTSGVYDAAAKEFTDTAADTTVAGTVTGSTAGQWKDVEVGDYLLQGTATRRITAIDATYAILTYEGLDLPTLAPAQTISILRTNIAVSYYARPLDKATQASTLAGISTNRGNRRVVHMWPDQVEMITGTDSQGNDVKESLPSYYAAAAEAGRDAVIPPQRASTGMALGGFTALENSNFYFKKSQLNTIAEGGWAILHQPTRGGSVLMRHLMTTDRSTVKTQEVAFTKNVDNMAKRKRTAMEPLLNDDKGRVNITKQFLSALAAPVQGIYENFIKDEQLVTTDDAPPFKILSLTQDTTNRDNILETTELNVPLPANRAIVTFVI
jgi:hypothetical protein